MNEEGVAEKITSLALPVLEERGLELVSLEYRKEGSGWVLRLFIDRSGGVTLDDCADISRAVEALLDADDIIPHEYNLEVSSPGLNRPLKKDADFRRFIGKQARVKTFEVIDGSRNFKGRIEGCEDGVAALNVDGIVHHIPLKKIAKANLEYEF
mgnify:CR=1 FL=1